MEPPDGVPPLEVCIDRFAKRMKLMISSADARWRKATLTEEPNQVIGHAGWLTPSSEHVDASLEKGRLREARVERKGRLDRGRGGYIVVTC
jgi:hypothetical protein